jgi:hypothetical protein
MAITGNAAELGNSANQFLGLAGTIDTAHSGVGAAFDSLTGWQGAGATQAQAAAQAVQANLDKARSSLTAAHQALVRYQMEVEQAQLGWDRSESEEQQFKTELAAAQAELATAQSQLSKIQNENAAAQTAYSNAVTQQQFSSAPLNLRTSPFSIPVPTMIPTGLVQAHIQHLQQKIQHLNDEIKLRETWKRKYEARAKAASAKVTSELNQAEQIWPTAGFGSWSVNGWTAKACLVGYNPPAPSQGSGMGLGGIAVLIGTAIVTIPLDEFGAGEAIDASVASAEAGAAAGSAAGAGAGAAGSAAGAGAAGSAAGAGAAAGSAAGAGAGTAAGATYDAGGNLVEIVGNNVGKYTSGQVQGLNGSAALDAMRQGETSGANVFPSRSAVEFNGQALKGRNDLTPLEKGIRDFFGKAGNGANGAPPAEDLSVLTRADGSVRTSYFDPPTSDGTGKIFVKEFDPTGGTVSRFKLDLTTADSLPRLKPDPGFNPLP